MRNILMSLVISASLTACAPAQTEISPVLLGSTTPKVQRLQGVMSDGGVYVVSARSSPAAGKKDVMSVGMVIKP